MDERIERAVEQLRAAQVELRPGLSEDECVAVEEMFGFRFGREHRELLAACLPVGDIPGRAGAGRRGPGFWDWRDEDPDRLRAQLDRPVDGVLFDVEHNDFWWQPWGRRPERVADRPVTARRHLERVPRLVPRLVPLYGHRYLPADPAPEPCPVLSVWQTDVIHYGWDITSYLDHELGVAPLDYSDPPADLPSVPFWGHLDQPADP